jgi:serine protease inhibitor
MRYGVAILVIFVCLAACRIAVASQKDVAAAYTAFGLKVLAQTRRANPGKNVFLSPAGLAFALSMVANGARGETLREMLAAMEVTSATPDLNQANRELLEHLSSLSPKIKLEIANSVWTAQDCRVNADFLGIIRQDYSGEVAAVDFRNPATATRINDWVGDHTHGKITQMVSPPLGANRLILLDAIYFKGDWTRPFNTNATQDKPFTLESGQTVNHPLMHQSDAFEYFENDAFQAARLPYADGKVSMLVFLPRKGLDDFLPMLTAENWASWTRQLHKQKGVVALPRVKLDNEYDLNHVLEAMGMRLAFTHHADFHGIAPERLFIDWIKQKTFVDVNEQGTEAAAVTGIGVRSALERREPPPFVMIVNRPYVMAIRDDKTGALLFIGAIVDPRS